MVNVGGGPMAFIRDSVEISAPVDKVFAYTTQAEFWPRWQSFIPEAEQTSQGKVGVGTAFKGRTRLLGLTLKWTAKATEFELNTRWSKDIASGSVFLNERMSVEPNETRTNFTISYDITMGGPMKLFSPMIVCSMRRETKKSLANLKRVLEG